MKTQVQAYQPAPDRPFPEELSRSRESAIFLVSGFMRLFGLARISTRPQGIGLTAISTITLRPMPCSPPDLLANGRSFMARQMGDIMLYFGITDIELSPTEQEYSELRKQWDSFLTDETRARRIKLNVADDPTNAPVFSDEPGDVVFAPKEPTATGGLTGTKR